MTWKRMLLAWTTLLALVITAVGATANTSVSPKPHVGAFDLMAGVGIKVTAHASAEKHQGISLAGYDGTSDVPHAARGAKVTGNALKAARKAFNRVKPKFWKNEAATNARSYSSENLARMRQGKAPIGADGHPMELHHRTPLAEGGTNAFDNLQPMTRTQHRLGPNYKQNHPNQP